MSDEHADCAICGQVAAAHAHAYHAFTAFEDRGLGALEAENAGLRARLAQAQAQNAALRAALKGVGEAITAALRAIPKDGRLPEEALQYFEAGAIALRTGLAPPSSALDAVRQAGKSIK